MLRRTHYARETLGLEPINPGPVVREFAVRVPDLDGLFERARAEGINPGYRLGATLPRVRGRPAGGDHRAPHARPTSTGWPRVARRAREEVPA